MKRILVTGAGGFIGGRLVEVLKQTSAADINILLRNIAKAARISRYPLHYFKGSVDDEGAVKAAMKDCEVVIHCAHDFTNRNVNLVAADLIARQCLENRIKKLIYISSFSVHNGNDAEIIDENSLLNDQWDYAVNKIEVEKKLVDYYVKDGLPVVILRPTVVYGPFSSAWTIHTINQMIGGRLVVPYDGRGVCNAVYIDDVVHAIIKALNGPASAHGRSYLVSGSEVVSWKEFYNSHLTYSGTNEPVYMSNAESIEWEKKIKSGRAVEKKDSLLKDPITFLKKTSVYNVYQKLLKTPFFKKRLLSVKANIPRPLIYPQKDAFEILSCKGKADISKIRSELGFQPAFSFHEGMKKTRLWIEWANLNLDA